jgi:NAD+ diphosphatase
MSCIILKRAWVYFILYLDGLLETYHGANIEFLNHLDAQWHSREDVRKALMFAEYEKAQRTAAAKVDQMCRGVEKGQSLSSDFNVESGELAPMFFPVLFAIAHRLITSWVNQGSTFDALQLKQQPNSYQSNL